VSYHDWYLDGWMRDQASLSVRRFECQVCEQEYPLAEKARASYSNTCLRCDEEETANKENRKR